MSPEKHRLALTRLHRGRADVFLLNLADGGLVRVTADGASAGAAFLR